MASAGYVWECEKYHRVNSFTQLPEEIIDEKENNNLENLQWK